MSRVTRERPFRSPWTREEAVGYLRRLGEDRGRTPTVIDMYPYVKTFWKLFGSIRAAQIAAGFPPNPPGRPVSTRDTVREALLRGPLAPREICRRTGLSTSRVADCLNNMRRRGAAERLAYGIWSLADR